MKHFLLIPLLLICLLNFTSCKEPVVKPSNRKQQNTRTIEQVSSNIEQLASSDIQGNTPQSNSPSNTAQVLVIPLMDEMAKHEQPISWPDTSRNDLSQFPSQSETKIIKVSITTRGIPKTQVESVENRIINLLGSHTPQPFELRRSNAIDKTDQIWGQLHIDFKRVSVRLRKASKNAPLRSKYTFEFNMSLNADKTMYNNWNNWNLLFKDEVPVTSESAVETQFWKKLEQSFPLFTTTQLDNTDRWLRAQGLFPQILRGELNAIPFPSHQYYPSGCLLSDKQANGRHTQKIIKTLYSPYAPAHTLSLNPIAIACSRDATFLVTSESTTKMALYYQPVASIHAWKSVITFEDPVRTGDLDIYIDDAVVCLYTGNPGGQSRSLEIQCLDRKTGLMQWKTSRLPGTRRGMASDENQLVFVNDQAIFSLARNGELRAFQPIKTTGKTRADFSCQLQNRLIFTTAPGHFVAWNMDTNEFDWQNTALDPTFIHCSHQNTFIYSDVGGYILAFDVEKNQPLWKYKLVATPRDAMTYGDVIYLLSDQAVVALDRSTGQLKAQIPLPWMAKKFITLNSHIYIDTEDAVYTWK